MSRIVVGVDGSNASTAALRWALEEARRRALPLEVVFAYESTPVWHAYAYEGLVSSSHIATVDAELEKERRQAHEHARTVVDTMLGSGLDTTGVEIQTSLVDEGPPASVLVERAADAEMLVVGSRGRGGFAGLLLGSVSQQCASHASCPVVIITEHAAD